MTEQALAVQRMQDYIEEHLMDEITLADLARASLFPPGTPTGCFTSSRATPRRSTSAACGSPARLCCSRRAACG